jgi:RimJ/RimL family protein N-acetyltransferase
LANYPKKYEKAIALSDGTQVLFRPELSTDTEMLWQMFSTLSERSQHFLVNPFPRERIEHWTNNINYEKALPILAIVEEKGNPRIAGVASLEFHDTPAEKHKAEFGITVHDSYQNKGLGTALTGHMLVIARKKVLRKVTLNVLTTNERAISMYEKCGFKIEAKLRKESFVKGRYYDDYVMSVFL